MGWLRWVGRGLLAGCVAALVGCGGSGVEMPSGPAAVQAKDGAVANAGFAGNGMWWNPAEPGSGIFFEEQGGTGVLTLFLFEASGKPIWYAAAGPVRLTESGRTVFSGVLLRYSGGQPLNSTQAKTPASRTAGSVQVTFDGDTAQVQLPQRAFAVQKFNPSTRARPATASQPETGIYWNPAESGRGYTVEVNDGVATIGLFHYDAAGDPVWNLASGSLQAGAFQAALQAYEGGQLLAGLYQPARPLPAAGQLAATLAEPCAGILTLPERGAVAVQRFAFGSLGAGRECRAKPRPGVFAATALAGSAVVSDIKLVVLSPNSVDADILQGQAMPGVSLSISLVGEDAALAGKSYHAVVEDPDGLLSSIDKPEVIGGNGRILASFLRPQSVATLGERRGNFRIFVCLDAACTQQLFGAPLVLPYRVNVRGLQASKEAVLLNALSGVQPQTQTLSITLPKGAFSFTARMKAAGATVLTDAPALSQSFPAGFTSTVAVNVGFTSTSAPGLTTNAVVVTARFQTAKGVDEWVKEIPVYRENFASAASTAHVPMPSSEVQLRLPLDRLDSVPLDLKLMLFGTGASPVWAIEYLSSPGGTDGHPLARAWLGYDPAQSPPFRVASCNPLDTGPGRCLPAGRYVARLAYPMPGTGQSIYQVVILDVVASP